MPSKQRLEGYLLIDHRDSPGLSADLNHALGRPEGAEHGRFESATVTCGHCQTIVVVNPFRNRARGYCPKCDSYVCDGCEAARVVAFECKTFAKTIDDVLEAGGKQTNPVLPLVLSGV